MKITIGKKLVFGFGGILVLMLVAMLFCVGAYVKETQEYKTFTNIKVHQQNLMGDLMVQFKKKVQAWKDILLRGYDPAKLIHYKEELKQENEVIRQRVVELSTGPYHLSEEGKQQLAVFEKEDWKLQEGYDVALKIYVGGAGGNYREADATVVGMDRSPTALLDTVADQAAQLAEKEMSDRAAHASGLAFTVSLVGLAIFLLGLFLTFFVVRSIGVPLRSLMVVTEMIAKGDLAQKIAVKSSDEIGDLARSLGNMMDWIKEMAAIASKIADGDLQQIVRPKSEKDIFGIAFRSMIEGLKRIITSIFEATNQITAASNEILAASQQQASAAREQSSAVTETTTAAKELSTTSESVAESIKKVAQVAAHAMAGMSKIKESIDKTNGLLNSLGEKSQKIGKITDLIDDVADQTNLLAVNASIEAARAGEQGRGFTVVADEIRKLADSTAKSTKDITNLVELIQHEMSNAIMSMEQSVQNVEEEAKLAQQTTEKSKEIAMSTNQQISGAKQIAEAMMNIDETMKQVAAGAQQSQASVKILTGLAGELKGLASKFKL